MTGCVYLRMPGIPCASELPFTKCNLQITAIPLLSSLADQKDREEKVAYENLPQLNNNALIALCLLGLVCPC